MQIWRRRQPGEQKQQQKQSPHEGPPMLRRPWAQVIAQLGTKDAPSGLSEAASEYEREMEATLHDAVACVLAFDARLQGERDAKDLAAALQASA